MSSRGFISQFYFWFLAVKLAVRSREKLGRGNCFIVTHFPISLLMSKSTCLMYDFAGQLSWKSSSNFKHLLCEFSFPWSRIIVHCLLTTFELKTRATCVWRDLWDLKDDHTQWRNSQKMLCLDNCVLECENFFEVLKQKTFMRQCVVPWRCSTGPRPRHEKSYY